MYRRLLISMAIKSYLNSLPLFEIHNNVHQKVIGLDLNNLRESYLSKGLI